MKNARIVPRPARYLFVTVLCLGACSASAATPGREILDTSGVKGGLVVHLGCGDGKLTALLLPNERYLVHGLDASAANVAAARSHVRSLGLYGQVSVRQWDSERLPYGDNLVNLVVASGKWRVSGGR